MTVACTIFCYTRWLLEPLFGSANLTPARIVSHTTYKLANLPVRTAVEILRVEIRRIAIRAASLTGVQSTSRVWMTIKNKPGARSRGSRLAETTHTCIREVSSNPITANHIARTTAVDVRLVPVKNPVNASWLRRQHTPVSSELPSTQAIRCRTRGRANTCSGSPGVAQPSSLPQFCSAAVIVHAAPAIRRAMGDGHAVRHGGASILALSECVPSSTILLRKIFRVVARLPFRLYRVDDLCWRRSRAGKGIRCGSRGRRSIANRPSCYFDSGPSFVFVGSGSRQPRNSLDPRVFRLCLLLVQCLLLLRGIFCGSRGDGHDYSWCQREAKMWCLCFVLALRYPRERGVCTPLCYRSSGNTSLRLHPRSLCAHHNSFGSSSSSLSICKRTSSDTVLLVFFYCNVYV